MAQVRSSKTRVRICAWICVFAGVYLTFFFFFFNWKFEFYSRAKGARTNQWHQLSILGSGSRSSTSLMREYLSYILLIFPKIGFHFYCLCNGNYFILHLNLYTSSVLKLGGTPQNMSRSVFITERYYTERKKHCTNEF